jgi:hypothetical protein
MKKVKTLSLFALPIAFTLLFAACNNEMDLSAKSTDKVSAKTTGITTVTLNTSHGTNVVSFDNAKRKIVSSRSCDNETGLITSRSYDYDADNHIRMLNVKKPYSPETIYFYGAKEENISNSRSVISNDIIAAPKKVRTVTKTVAATNRSAATEESITTEYFADETGDIVAVIQKDAYGNIKMKSAVGD